MLQVSLARPVDSVFVTVTLALKMLEPGVVGVHVFDDVKVGVTQEKEA